MADDKHHDLRKFVEGKLSESEIGARLAPGCRLVTETERETRFPPNKPVEHWKRECSKISDCDDPSNNSDWVCRPWEFDY